MSTDAERALSVSPPPIKRWRSSGWLKNWPIYPATLFLILFFIYPVVLLLGLSTLDDAGTLTGEHYLRLFRSDLYVKVLLITLKVAAWTTFFSLLAAYPIAYLLSTVKTSTRNSLIIWVLMPFWTSFLVRTFAWMVLLGRSGAVNDLLLALDLVEFPIRMIYNFTGVMIGMVHALMPLGVLTMLSVMENIDSNLSKAGATLGGRPSQTFWRIYFPLSLPGVAAGGLLIFITALGFFITPALLGGRKETMIVQVIIFQIHEVLNWGFAGAISVLLLVTVLLIFFIYDRLLGLSTLSGQSSTPGGKRPGLIARAGSTVGHALISALGNGCEFIGRAFEQIRPPRADRPRIKFGRRMVWVAGLLVLAFLSVPALFVIPVSFTEEGFLNWPPVGFSWKWYESITSSDMWAVAALRSFVVATCSAFLAMVLGVPAAFVLVRKNFFGKTALFGFLISPIITPHIIIAVSLFYLYAKLSLIGTTIGLVLGHTVIATPYVIVTVMAIIKNYDISLDHAAWTLGATKARTMWHITMPLIRGGLIAAFMFGFIISFDELTIALFVTGGEFTTLPKQMWDDAILRVSPALAAVATLLLLFMSTFILITEFLRRRGQKS
jgi:putative spermidine/putrescine transport system permease protein